MQVTTLHTLISLANSVHLQLDVIHWWIPAFAHILGHACLASLYLSVCYSCMLLVRPLTIAATRSPFEILALHLSLSLYELLLLLELI